MRQYTSVITLALLSALALAVVSGGLFPSDNLVHAGTMLQADVPEDTPLGTNVGAPVDINNPDDKTLKFSIDGTEAFAVDELTGQVITKAPLDHEDSSARLFTFSVIATNAHDSSDEVDRTSVVIMVGDEDEPPLAPAAPTVTSGSNATSLEVHWDAPDNPGRESITSYDVQYKKAAETDFSTPVNDSGSPYTITSLDEETYYHVRVRAKNAEGDGAWSLVGTGMTNRADNSAPSFSTPRSTENVPENTPAGQNVGSAVRATDSDSTTLVYSLEGRDADSFDIERTSGQIITKAALNYEGKREYTVLVKVDDGDGGSAVAARTFTVTNVNETPSAPGRPTVVVGDDDESTDLPVDESTTTLKVTWHAPENTGPPITESDSDTSYTVEYREGTSGTFTAVSTGVDKDERTVTIGSNGTALKPNTSYQVRVQANNGEGTSGWSEIGTGKTNPANRAPFFSSAPATRSVSENTEADRNIGHPIGAQDQDGDNIEYSLGGDNEALFGINDSTGQIITKAALNHEEETCGYDEADNPTECMYSVTVTADDGKGAMTTKSVTIAVQDIGEPPAPPEKPTVVSVLDDNNPDNGVELTTKLNVSWSEPANTGPAITSYEVQYRVRGGVSPVNDTINMEDRTVTITGLTADTTYHVEVRAINAEGTGRWSQRGSGKTSAESTNVLPQINSGNDITLTLPENPAENTDIGSPFTVTDSDSNSFTYFLEGVDADSFSIDPNGQLKTKSGVTYNFEDKSSYSLMIKVEDNHGGSSTITVTINIQDDTTEEPETPAAPTVTANEDDLTTGNVDESVSTLDLSWSEPANPGPAITNYLIQHRIKGSGDDWPSNPIDCASVSGDEALKKCFEDREYTLTELTDGATYEVQVKVKSSQGESPWSSSGGGSYR